MLGAAQPGDRARPILMGSLSRSSRRIHPTGEVDSKSRELIVSVFASTVGKVRAPLSDVCFIVSRR